MPSKEFEYDTVLSKSGSSQILVVPPKFFVITGLKKNSRRQLRITIQVLILLIALGSMTLAQEEKQTISMGSLLNKVEQTNTRITELQKQFTADIIDVNKTLSDKIDGLFNRVVIAVVGVQLFILGSSKAIGGLAKYIRGRKKTKAVNKNNQLLEEILPLLTTLNTIEAVKEAQTQDEPKKTKSRFNPYNIIIAGVIAIIALLVLNKFGVIG